MDFNIDIPLEDTLLAVKNFALSYLQSFSLSSGNSNDQNEEPLQRQQQNISWASKTLYYACNMHSMKMDKKSSNCSGPEMWRKHGWKSICGISGIAFENNRV